MLICFICLWVGCIKGISDKILFTAFFLQIFTVRYMFHNKANAVLINIYVFMSSLCGVGVRVRVSNFFSKTTRPRDMLFFLKDTLSIEDEKLFKACKSVCSSVC